MIRRAWYRIRARVCPSYRQVRREMRRDIREMVR